MLGPRLGPIYHAIYNEVVWLHVKWKQYRHLYASVENVDLLNEVAAFFFFVLQDVLWEDVLLHIARPTDPPCSAGKKNLTLQRLSKAIEESSLSKQVTTLIEDAVSQSKFARDWRNRRIAHRDLQLALDLGAKPLPAVSRAKVEHSLATLRDVLNAIEDHYCNSSTAFEDFIASSDAESLTYYLSEALKGEKK